MGDELQEFAVQVAERAGSLLMQYFGRLAQDGQCFLQPAADGSVSEFTLRQAVARIVEPEAGDVVADGPVGERASLAAGHIRPEP